MIYQALNWLNGVYPVAVFFLYLGLFALAFCVAFLIPAVAFLILIGSIFALLPFVFANHILQASERGLARRSIRRGACPACGGALTGSRLSPSTTTPTESESPDEQFGCAACRRSFDTTGTSAPLVVEQTG